MRIVFTPPFLAVGLTAGLDAVALSTEAGTGLVGRPDGRVLVGRPDGGVLVGRWELEGEGLLGIVVIGGV